jgi:hypothetical protein
MPHSNPLIQGSPDHMTKRKAQDVEQPISLPVEKPEPTDAERAEVRDYLARAKARRRAPRFAVERQPGKPVRKPVRLNPTQVHPGVAAVRMMNALGTTSVDLADRLVGQILNTTHLQPSGQPISEQNLNAAVAAVTGIGPRDEAEAMLAAQMVGVHWTAMELLRQVGATGNRLQFIDAGNLAMKLLRTYTAQIEALKRYRSAGEQRVVVQHQHVTVTADQAAVQVNPVPAPRGEGDGSNTKERAHAQADPTVLAHAPSAPMPCPDPAGDAVPAASSEREDTLPDARRG